MFFIMENVKRDYTTGEAAKICRISQQQIIRSCKEGDLKSYHVPMSKHRRIQPEALYKFMLEKRLPLDGFPPEDIPTAGLESCTTE